MSSRFYVLVFGWLGLLAIWSTLEGPRPALVIGLAWMPLATELIAAFYVISTLLKSLDYLIGRDHARPVHANQWERVPRVGVLYLCCDDLDERAFDSLCALQWEEPLEILVHDDGRGDPGPLQRRVTRIAARHGARLVYLRRPERAGGKPGAVNYVLREAGGRFDFLLLCDSDSTALDAGALRKGLAHFLDPSVAAVQFRGRGTCGPHDPPLVRRLARAIDIFDLFATHQSRHGMMPFLGHNGLVRVQALREAGGLTSGFLSDDIDVSVRWYLSGLRVVYERGVAFAEKPPGTYAAFRLRARKWACGCAQVIRRHAPRMILSRDLSLPQKLGFLEFVGFYAVQVLLLAYLVEAHILRPLLAPDSGAFLYPTGFELIAGAAVIGAIFMPTLSFCMKERRLEEWPELAWTCCMVYGSAAFETCRGILGGLAGRAPDWVPTNGHYHDRSLALRCWLESVFGLALFLVPLIRMPGLLLVPVGYIFAACYLFSPIILACYGAPAAHRPAWRLPAVDVLPVVLIAILLTLAAALLAAPPALGAEVRVEGRHTLVDGHPFFLKGIHYSPWPPGTGPGKGLTWPPTETVGRDLDMIRSLHANTILVYDDSAPSVFDEAAARGLMVLQAFSINWQAIDDDARWSTRRAEILQRVDLVKDRPNLLGWVLGNEVTEWVVDRLGPRLIAGCLEDLARAVRQADPRHPITHANWPITKNLPLPFLDIVSFNVYPLWPREVVVRGYGDYIRDVLLPLAGGRPLWITEFGLNTLESSPDKQAKTLQRCWEEIRRYTSGGVVFSFADEWWKNYDNPVARGKYWEREPAPDDERAHDLDPEEYYGIVDDQRLPKPAFAAVGRMYGDSGASRPVVLAAVMVLLMSYTVYVFKRRV